MKLFIAFMVLSTIFISCNRKAENETSTKTLIPLQGTWKLLSGTTVEKGNSTVTDYTKDKEFIKIINDTHFAFLSHDLNKGKDSAAAFLQEAAFTHLLIANTLNIYNIAVTGNGRAIHLISPLL